MALRMCRSSGDEVMLNGYELGWGVWSTFLVGVAGDATLRGTITLFGLSVVGKRGVFGHGLAFRHYFSASLLHTDTLALRLSSGSSISTLDTILPVCTILSQNLASTS